NQSHNWRVPFACHVRSFTWPRLVHCPPSLPAAAGECFQSSRRLMTTTLSLIAGIKFCFLSAIQRLRRQSRTWQLRGGMLINQEAIPLSSLITSVARLRVFNSIDCPDDTPLLVG